MPRTRALLPAALALVLSGCLVPQSVEPASARQHQPPRFVVETLPDYEQTAQLTLLRSSLEAARGCHCELVLQPPTLEDLDPTAELEVRWFLNYNPARFYLENRPIVDPTALHGTVDPAATIRTVAPFVFDVDRFGIVSDGVNTVDVAIAESGAFKDADPSQAAPYRTVTDGFASATWRFVVNVKTDNSAECPKTPPSRQNCSAP